MFNLTCASRCYCSANNECYGRSVNFFLDADCVKLRNEKKKLHDILRYSLLMFYYQFMPGRVFRDSKAITPNKGMVINISQTIKGYSNLCHVDA